MTTDSTRFLVQNIMNILICNYAQKKISKEALNKSHQKSVKYYGFFVLFTIVMLLLNQIVYFSFKPRNIYQ